MNELTIIIRTNEKGAGTLAVKNGKDARPWTSAVVLKDTVTVLEVVKAALQDSGWATAFRGVKC